METHNNIITIRNNSIREADEAFNDFMLKTESRFNEESKKNPAAYRKLSPTELEFLTEKVLKDIAPSTPFRPEEIKLVAGHSFPDIISETYYGVEVKSTKENRWTSTGSSIVETTRNPNVENIYMLFGKLGGDPPEFRCKPYQDCLSNIAVTHSPRYLIDMELNDRKDKTIFDKMNVSYHDFQKNDDKIEIVRDYYIRRLRAEHKQEMPWWVGNKTIETSDSEVVPSIHLMANCSEEEINMLKAQMVILFPEVINGEYAEAALWLCTHRYILNLSFRDLFSAGGQWKVLNGERLETPYPAVLGKLMAVMPYVKTYLTTDSGLEYREFNAELFNSEDKLSTWLSQIKATFNQHSYKVGKKKFLFADLHLDLNDYLLHPERYRLKNKI